MSVLRRFILAVVPQRLAADMEAESRQWILRCSECGTEVSVWDAGGLRWQAAGNPSRWIVCHTCGRRTRHATSYRPAEGDTET